MFELRSIPASHIAPALGFVDWSTPLATYLSCRRERPWDVNPDAPVRGVRLAPALRLWANDILGKDFAAVRTAFVGTGRLSHLSAQPDGVSSSGNAVLVLRTPRKPEEWLPPKPDDGIEEDDEALQAEVSLTGLMPLDVRLECSVIQAVMSPVEIWVGAMIAGRLTMRLFNPSDDTLMKVQAAANLFWKRYVQEMRPPAAKLGDEETLRALFPKPERALPVSFGLLSEKERESVLRWAAAQRQRTAAQKIEKEERPTVLQAIGDAPGICDLPKTSGITSVSCDSRAPYANNATWKAISEVCLNEMSPRRRKRMLDKYTPVIGTRVLRPFFEKKAEAA